MTRRPLIAFVLLLATMAAPAAPAGAAAIPIAHYPLLSDALDATGLNDPMTLQNAPFQDGGVYCNGIPPSSGEGACLVETPVLAALDFGSFAISLEFKIDQYPDESIVYRPVLVGGYSYRWMGAEVRSDGTIFLMYNNNNGLVYSDRIVTLGAWHRVVMTYDSSTQTGRLYMDGELACSAEFVIEHGNDKNLGTTNRAVEKTFLGLIREIVVYDTAFDPTPAETPTWGRLKAAFR